MKRINEMTEMEAKKELAKLCGRIDWLKSTIEEDVKQPLEVPTRSKLTVLRNYIKQTKVPKV